MTDSEWQILDLSGRWIDAPSKEAAIGCIKDGTATATALRRLASSDGGVKGAPEPVAWRYELADGREWSNGEPGQYTGWHERLSKTKPNVPEGSIRNLEPLFTTPPADAGMREAFVRVLVSLAAAISILERAPKAKKAVASDKMFNTMLEDYRKALEAGRTALTAPGATTKSDGGERDR